MLPMLVGATSHTPTTDTSAASITETAGAKMTVNKNKPTATNIKKVAKKTKNPTAIIATNKGVMKLEIFQDKAPLTSANFIKLANRKFYNGTRFHRVIPKFMIQGGDPLSKDVKNKAMWGTGDAGYKFKDEFGVGLKNDKFTISMANSGPHTNSSQFFINVENNNFLDQKHSVFGKVTKGEDTATMISNVKKGMNDVPDEGVIIKSIVIVK